MVLELGLTGDFGSRYYLRKDDFIFAQKIECPANNERVL